MILATTKTLTIVGKDIHNISSFYAEINRVFMSEENWKLGENLDALDDMLRGGYGAIRGYPCVKLVWKDIGVARSSLGLEATRTYLRAKLERPDLYNVDWINDQISALEAGTGQTYFEIILEIIAGHQSIEIVSDELSPMMPAHQP